MRLSAIKIGDRFGALVVTGRGGVARTNRAFVVRCDCGRTKEMESGNLRRAKSCGCMTVALGRDANTTHGGTGTPTHEVWLSMIKRCHSPGSRDYVRYGARGIAVCQRWRESFTAFLADMGEKPSGLSIERTDNDRGYEPGNCIWATASQQARNRRTTRLDAAAVELIRRRHRAGEPKSKIARDLGVGFQTVSDVLLGRTWRAA